MHGCTAYAVPTKLSSPAESHPPCCLVYPPCLPSCLFLQVFTLIAAGCVSALLFAIFTFSPGRFEANDLVALRSSTLSTTNSTLKALQANAVAQNPANTTLAAQVSTVTKSLASLGDPSKKWISNQGVINTQQATTSLANAQLQQP